MFFRRVLDPPAHDHSWVVWLLAAGVTLLLFLTLGLPTGNMRRGGLWWVSREQHVPSRRERIVYQRLPPPAVTRAPTAPPAVRRPARTPAHAPATAPRDARITPDSAKSTRAAARSPSTTSTTGLSRPDARLTRPTNPTSSPERSASPACAVPCVDARGADARSLSHTLTPAERDSVLHALSNSVPELAREKGGGNARDSSGVGGISLPIGLPGGGPSRAQRRRDSVNNAHALVILRRLWARADSVREARRRDSLDAIAKQQRDSTSGRDDHHRPRE